MIDKGAGTVCELNIVEECREVEQKIRGHMLLVGQWGKPRKCRNRKENMGLYTNMVLKPVW